MWESRVVKASGVPDLRAGCVLGEFLSLLKHRKYIPCIVQMGKLSLEWFA